MAVNRWGVPISSRSSITQTHSLVFAGVFISCRTAGRELGLTHYCHREKYSAGSVGWLVSPSPFSAGRETRGRWKTVRQRALMMMMMRHLNPSRISFHLFVCVRVHKCLSYMCVPTHAFPPRGCLQARNYELLISELLLFLLDGRQWKEGTRAAQQGNPFQICVFFPGAEFCLKMYHPPESS